jgi:hypothetical protein
MCPWVVHFKCPLTIPVHIASPDASDVFSPAYHIEYPNGVIARLLEVDVRVLVELINFQAD